VEFLLLHHVSGVADDDVWYKFVARQQVQRSAYPASGNNLTSSGVNVQVFSGSCGSLTSIGCGTTTVTVNGLTTSPATTYYVRVYSTGSGNIATAGDFGIMVSDPNALSATNVTAGRMNEVFAQTILSGSGGLQYPWEITYGPDNMLWITEARGYKVDRMDPNTGAKTTVLDLNSTSSDLTAWGADSLRAVNLNQHIKLECHR
jgi:streptogramin lyase